MGTGRVAGLDINKGMLAVARSRSAGPEPHIEWHEGSALDLPFPDSSFDLILCQLGLQFFPDQPRALREMMRVLVPNGRLALNVFTAIERFNHSRVHGCHSRWFLLILVDLLVDTSGLFRTRGRCCGNCPHQQPRCSGRSVRLEPSRNDQGHSGAARFRSLHRRRNCGCWCDFGLPRLSEVADECSVIVKGCVTERSGDFPEGEVHCDSGGKAGRPPCPKARGVPAALALEIAGVGVRRVRHVSCPACDRWRGDREIQPMCTDVAAPAHVSNWRIADDVLVGSKVRYLSNF